MNRYNLMEANIYYGYIYRSLYWITLKSIFDVGYNIGYQRIVK